MDEWRLYHITYQFEGDEWPMTIVARDGDEAMRRIRQAAVSGRVDMPTTLPGRGVISRLRGMFTSNGRG